MKTQVFRLDEISPAEYNPRQDLKPGDKQYEAIRHSIEAYGFVEPLVVNVRDGKNVLVMTMAEFLRNNWNNIKGATSPARAYGGILKPSGLDEKGDVIYKYNGKR